MNRIRVAILFGGPSEEHAVSVKSAVELAAGIDPARYEPFYIGITRDGVWRLCERPRLDWEKATGCPVIFSPDRQTHGFLLGGEGGYQVQTVDVVFPMLHGKSGEDGSIQGLLELSGIPYVGCDIQSSVTCMDKTLAYAAAKSAGIEVPEFQILQKEDRPDAAGFRYPVFVKPARSGSSFGVSKVEQADDLYAAINEARKFDSKVLIEEAVSGSEVGCAVLGNSPDVMVGEVDQIALTHGFFRIHQEAQPEKGSENAAVRVPADLPLETQARIQETARKIYRTLGCRGLSRVDLFLREDGRIVLNEVNTMPGFTSYSRYPRMMAAAGFPVSDVFDRLIELSLRRSIG